MRTGPIIALLLLCACGDQHERVAYEALRAGNAEFRDADFEDAATHYSRATFDARALHNMGKAHYKAHAPGASVEEIGAAVALMSEAPDLAHVNHDLGNARLKLSQWADSLSSVTGNELKAIRMEGDDITGKVRLAMLRDSLKTERRRLDHLADSSLAQGVLAYKQALRHDPTDEDTRYNLALGLQLLAARKKAARDGQGPTEEDQGLSENAKALIEKADELVKAYRFKDALELLQRGLQQDPTLSQQKQYIDKLDVVTKAAEAS